MPLSANFSPLARTAGLQTLALVISLMLAPPAHALCIGACSCTASATPLVFSAHNPLVVSNNDISGTVRVACGGVAGLLIPYSVAISAGTSGSMAGRQMASGANRLGYNLYTTAGRSTVWGDGSGSTATVSGSVLLDVLGMSLPQDLPVFGRIPGGQYSVAPGSYSDTLVVTLTYF